MPFTFPGAVKISLDGNSFHVPVVIYAADGVTTIDSSSRLPVDALPAGSSSLKGSVMKVTTAGTRVQLPSYSCREVTIIAKRGNTGFIFVGGNDVSATIFGVELSAKESITIPVANANLIYIDATVSGEGISYVAV